MDKFVNRRIPQIGYDTDFISRAPFHPGFLCIGERVEILGRWDDSARGMEIRSEMHGMLIKKQALVKMHQH